MFRQVEIKEIKSAPGQDYTILGLTHRYMYDPYSMVM